MLGFKDLVFGLLTLFMIAVFVPVFLIVFKLSIIVAIPLAIGLALLIGIAVLGRIVRYIFFEKQNPKPNKLRRKGG